MLSNLRFSFLIMAAMIIPLAVSAATKEPATYSRMTYSGRVAVDKSLRIGIVRKGIKIESITFSGDEAVIVVSNKRAKGVKGHIGIALYDRKKRLIAAESDSQSIVRKVAKIRPGKQANMKVKFGKFVSNFRGISSYRLVFVTKN